MDSRAQNLTETARHDMCCIVVFPDLFYAYKRRYKIGNINMHLTNLNSIESSTLILDIKFLSELRFYLNILN